MQPMLSAPTYGEVIPSLIPHIEQRKIHMEGWRTLLAVTVVVRPFSGQESNNGLPKQKLKSILRFLVTNSHG